MIYFSCRLNELYHMIHDSKNVQLKLTHEQITPDLCLKLTPLIIVSNLVLYVRVAYATSYSFPSHEKICVKFLLQTAFLRCYFAGPSITSPHPLSCHAPSSPSHTLIESLIMQIWYEFINWGNLSSTIINYVLIADLFGIWWIIMNL